MGPGSGPATVEPVRAGGAPTFTATTIDGKAVAFPGDFSGKKVLLVFWATWCTPCRAEMPHLREAHEKLAARGLEIVGVSVDTKAPDSVKKFADEQKLIWRHVYDNKADVARKFGVEGIPALFLVDGATGKILASGEALRGDDLVKVLEKYLNS